MTRAGSAVDQPAVPPAANIVRVRDPSTRQEAAAAKEGTKEEFQDLLSKLKGTDSEGADQPASAKTQSGQIEPRHARQRAIEAQLAKADGDGSGKIGDGSLGASTLGTQADNAQIDAAGADDPRLQMPSEQSSDATAINAGTSAAPGFSDIAAAATLTLAPLAGCNGSAAAQQTSASQPEDPSAAAVTALEASVSGQAPAIKAGRALKGPVEPADERAKQADSTDRILAAANAAVDAVPDKGALPLDAGALKVTVWRSETHFAPALRSEPASPLRSGAAKGEATTIGTDATTKAPTNATAKVGSTAGTSTNIGAAAQANVVRVAEAPAQSVLVGADPAAKAPASAKLSAVREAPAPNNDHVGTISEAKSPEGKNVSTVAEAKAPQNGQSGAMSEDRTADSSKHGIKTDSKGGEPAALPIDGAPSIDAVTPAAGTPTAASVPPTQQIAARITAEVPAFISAARGAAAPAQAGMKPAIKVLQIELQPADLGTVSVRMELKDTGLRLHVEADRPETADLIRGDEDTLSKLLRSAGYDINPASIRVVEGDRSVTPAQGGQQGAQTGLQASTQSQSGWSGRQERPQHGNANPNGGDAQIATSRNDGHEATKTRAGDDLYI